MHGKLKFISHKIFKKNGEGQIRILVGQSDVIIIYTIIYLLQKIPINNIKHKTWRVLYTNVQRPREREGERERGGGYRERQRLKLSLKIRLKFGLRWFYGISTFVAYLSFL